MRSILSFIFLLNITFSFSKNSNQNDTVYYSISPSKTTHTLHIRLKFIANSSETKIYFPNSWANETKYHKCIRNLVINNKNEHHVIDENKLEIDSLENVTYSYFSESPNQQYSIEYDLIQDTVQDLQYNGKYAGQFRPIIQDNFFQINGYQFMLLPDFIFDTTFSSTIKISFTNFSPKWHFAGSLVCNKNTMLIPHNYPDYFQNIGIIGTTNTIHKKIINNCNISIVNLNGINQFNDTTIINKAYRVLDYQINNVWKDTMLLNYTISLVEYKVDKNKIQSSFYNGTALNNMFAVATTSTSDVESLDYLFGHELTHYWIGGKIDFEGNNFTINTWFSEGFTDYMTINNSYKNNSISFNGFLKSVNDVITAYYCSPVAEIPNDSLLNNHWKNYDYNKLPYRRGFVFAMYLNYLMKEHSDGKFNLTDFMRELFNWSIENINAKLSNTLFITMVNKHIDKPIDDFFKQHIIDGKLIEVDEWDFKNSSYLYYEKTKCNNKIIEIPQYKSKADF